MALYYLTLLLIAHLSLHGLAPDAPQHPHKPDPDYTDPKYTVCQRIKQLKHTDRSLLNTLFLGLPINAEYKKIAQELQEKGLDACQCTEYLIHRKKEKRIDLIKKRFNLSDQQIQHWHVMVDTLAQQARLPEPSIEFKGDFPAHIKQAITEAIIAKQLNYPITVSIENLDCSVVADVSEQYECVQGHDKLFMQLRIYQELIRHALLFVAVLDHELEHLVRHHNLKHKFLKIEISDKILNDNPLSSDKKIKMLRTLFNDDIIKKFIKSQEAEADRIPCACSDLQRSYNFLLSAKNDYYRKPDDTHPHPINAYFWAKALYTIRYYQEHLKQQ